MTAPHWHAADPELRAYVAGRATPATAASVEAHLLGCARCRGLVAGLVRAADGAALDAVWARVLDDVQAPAPTPAERVARRLGLGQRDALVAGAASAAHGSWLLGLLLCVLFAGVAVAQGQDTTSLLFLMSAPLLPVVGVAVAYGQASDPLWEPTLATPYPALRLLLLRSLSVVAVALPLAVVAGLLLPGPASVAAAWLVPALACTTVTLALSTWLPTFHAACVVSGAWVATMLLVAGPGLDLEVAVLSAEVLPLYVGVAVVAATVFWLRLDRLSLMGRLS